VSDHVDVDTQHGPVRGSTDGVVRVFKGIRYAAAPTGDRRWRAPEPPEAWSEPADATRFAAAPMQEHNPVVSFPDDVGFDEDCLFLNVWVAESVAAGTRRPVLVWVHGGAYVYGGTAQRMYDGRALAHTGEAIIVTVGYRVGALGFLDLSRLGAPGSFLANPALEDVLAALRWVRENIAAFGGDPDAVTLFGESAGGGIVTTLMTAPRARGLFHRAIAESSPATSVYGQDRSERIARLLLDDLGVDPGDVETLRAMPAARLTAAGMALFTRIPLDDPGTLAFAPVVDGDLVPQHPVAVFAQGAAAPVPLIIGTNHDETALFTHVKSPLMPVSSDALATMTADLRAERPDLDVPTDAEIASAYAGMHAHARGPAISRDLAFRLPAVWIAEGHGRVAPTYLYRFDWATPMLRVLGIGATHGTELPYVWGNLVNGPKDITFRLGGLRTGRAISARMQSRWISFATGGVPDAGAADAPWRPYTPAERHSLIVDKSDTAARNLDAEGLEAWGSAPLSFP
jgi:para-nitrobenzyl esterase